MTSCYSEKCNCIINNQILKENIEFIKKQKKSNSWNELGLQDHTKFKNDTYRLIIFPSWENSEVLEYQLENDLENPKISINRYERINDTEKIKLKKIGQTEKIFLSKNDWNQFDKSMTELCFWTMPISSKNKYLDGTSWILEGKKDRVNKCSNQNYHMVSRVEDSPVYFELCDKLLKLANSSKKEQDNLLDKSWTSD